MLKPVRLGILLLGLLTIFPAWSDETIIGYVKTVELNAEIFHNNSVNSAHIGSPIYAGSTIKTDAKGTIGLALKDDTLISIGPDSEFKISEFVYQPSDEKLKLEMQIIKGTLEYISGVISKLKPEAIQLITPTSIIGVRGTHFVVKVDD